eukprot:755206-Hanusia_phi.AAC.6
MQQEQWTTGLFGCLAWRKAWDQAQRIYAMDGPCCKCSLVFHSLCHSVIQANNINKLTSGQQIMCLLCFPVTSGENRTRIRKQKQIPGSLACDIVIHTCCFPCALAQEARELKDDPFQSTDQAPFPTWRRIFKPCFPMSKRDARLIKAAEEAYRAFFFLLSVTWLPRDARRTAYPGSKAART